MRKNHSKIFSTTIVYVITWLRPDNTGFLLNLFAWQIVTRQYLSRHSFKISTSVYAIGKVKTVS